MTTHPKSLLVDIVVDSGTEVAGREEVVVESMGTDVDCGTDVVATDVVLATGGRASTPTSNWE